MCLYHARMADMYHTISVSNPPQRTVICRDAVAWLKEQNKIQGSVITSLPDLCEVPMNINEWKEWFSMCVHEILMRLDEHECAIFYQTDVKLFQTGQGFVEWVDKSYLVNKGCENTPCKLVWHKIMSFTSDITKHSITKRKAGYSHMLCFRKDATRHDDAMPDVVPRGTMVWTKGMGFNACTMAVKYCKQIGSKCIVDPFCGKGSVLAVANYMGLDSIGGKQILRVQCSTQCTRIVSQYHMCLTTYPLSF